jgi:hypothetical protein
MKMFFDEHFLRDQLNKYIKIASYARLCAIVFRSNEILAKISGKTHYSRSQKTRRQ